MPRSHPLAATVLALVAVAVAWAGTALALASTDPDRIDSIHGGCYVLTAVTATLLVVATCLCALPAAVAAAAGVTASLWWGASEAKAVLDVHSGGWMGGFNDLVYLVPVAAAGVCLVSLVTCAAVFASSSRPSAVEHGCSTAPAGDSLASWS